MSHRRTFFTLATAALLAVLTAPAVFPQDKPVLPEELKLEGGVVIFDSSTFQSEIRSGKSLGELAKEHSTIGEKATAFGFAAKSEEAKFFTIGALYAESLAYLRGGDTDMAAKRLQAIEKEFIVLDVPNSLFNYISKTRNLIETKRYPMEALGEFLALFQPLFEDYAKGKVKGEDFLTLFRSGSWLVDMSLAAAAGDIKMLKQKATLDYFISEMKRMDAPKGVLDALEGIAKISGQEDIPERDTRQVLKLVGEIQSILG